MKVVVLVALVCLVGVDSNIYTFFSMLTDGITVQFQNAWSAVKEFVKRPPRYKQRRQENVQPTQPPNLLNRDRIVERLIGCTDMVIAATTTEFTTKTMAPTTEFTTKKYIMAPITEFTIKKYTMPQDMMYYFQRPRHKQVLLPIIKIPQWDSRDDWLAIQQPNLGFVYRKGRFHPGAKDRERGMKKFPVTKDNDYYGDVTTAEQLDDNEEDEDIGVMMFV